MPEIKGFFVPKALLIHISLIHKVLQAGLGVILVAPSGFGKSSIILGLSRYYQEHRLRENVKSLGGVNRKTLALELMGNHKDLLIVIDDMAPLTDYGQDVLIDVVSRLITEKKLDKFMVGGQIPLSITVEGKMGIILGAQPPIFFDFIGHKHNFLALARDRFLPIIMLVPKAPKVLPPIDKAPELREAIIQAGIGLEPSATYLEAAEQAGIPADEARELLEDYLGLRFTPSRAQLYAERLMPILSREEFILLADSLSILNTTILFDEAIGKIYVSTKAKRALAGLQYMVYQAYHLGPEFNQGFLRCALSMVKFRHIRALLEYLVEPGTDTSTDLAISTVQGFLQVKKDPTGGTKLTRGHGLRPFVQDVVELTPEGYNPCLRVRKFITL